MRPKFQVYRFLSGKKFNVRAAAEQYQAMVKWRCDEKVDEISKWGVENRGKITEMDEMYPTSPYGYDKMGRPIIIARFGAVPGKKFSEAFSIEEYLKRHILKMEEMMELCRKRSVELKKPIHSVTVIVDAEGVDSATRHFIPYFRAQSEIEKQNYPECVTQILLINAPWIVPMLFSIVKVFIDPTTRKKIELHSGIPKERLFEVIEPSILPVCYGGKNLKKIPGQGKHEQKDDNTRRLNIPAGKSITMVEEVSEKGGNFLWTVKVISYDVSLRVTWRPEECEEKRKLVFEKRGSELYGDFDARTKGVLEITFDNTYSYFKSKDIEYVLDVLDVNHDES
mmetsp:Transcript_1898/g.2736  ORF Transcript_1898/g.2736 Transcript_1898/m.2736 type:complete len:338 (-) Transcript_1898:101-1114(-)|eukprot:CAMPEP_0185265312 /NCGR_PEP_ID=MMETSP1359-20130426/27087_1 /TAXON_ID=552665 /ORGANISM="Bigelowiella longifila, Strain CCMP242" /LENGTH=337 /DNA_ID=CAMNT_0027854507 /DNA_START=154 /DNA_END=1167 /DNA_ORIENTATION=+